MELKTHEANIPQIRAAVEAFGEVWVHGSGDIFRVHNPADQTSVDESKTHSENVNPGYEEGQYRVKINRTNLPKSKAELDMMLMQAKAYGDRVKHETEVGANRVTNIVVQDAHYGAEFVEPEGAIDYSKFVKK